MNKVLKPFNCKDMQQFNKFPKISIKIYGVSKLVDQIISGQTMAVNPQPIKFVIKKSQLI